jgi:hypothetical protein
MSQEKRLIGLIHAVEQRIHQKELSLQGLYLLPQQPGVLFIERGLSL